MYPRVDQQGFYVGEEGVEKVCPQPGALARVQRPADLHVLQRQRQNPDFQVLPPRSTIFLA